jgi:HSP20 family protein
MASPQSQSPFQSSRELTRGEPFFDLHRGMNRLFDDVFKSSLWPLTAAQQVGAMMAPVRVDVEERDDELCITADLPGVQQSDVEVKVDGDTLTISGERKSSSEHKQQNFHLMERSYGRFERSMQLPFEPQPERAQAEFDNGVLTIHLPKEESQQRSRRIEIRGAEGGDGKRQIGNESSRQASGGNKPQGESSGSSSSSSSSSTETPAASAKPDASRKQSQHA